MTAQQLTSLSHLPNNQTVTYPYSPPISLFPAPLSNVVWANPHITQLQQSGENAGMDEDAAEEMERQWLISARVSVYVPPPPPPHYNGPHCISRHLLLYKWRLQRIVLSLRGDYWSIVWLINTDTSLWIGTSHSHGTVSNRYQHIKQFIFLKNVPHYYYILNNSVTTHWLAVAGSERETEKDEDASQLEAGTILLNDTDKRSLQLQVRGDRSSGSQRQNSRFVGRPQRTGDMAIPALARPSPLPSHGQGQGQKRASLDALIARLNQMSGVRHPDNGRISLVRFGPGR